MDAETKAAIIRTLKEADDANALFERMNELQRGKAEGAFDESEEIEHLAAALHRLRHLTERQPLNARRAIFDFLLPLCIRESDEFSTKVTLYSVRELLSSWFNEVPAAWYEAWLEECAGWLAERLRDSSIDPVCWTISEIGYRTTGLVWELENIIGSHPDDPNDSALGTRIGLGDLSTEYERFVGIVHSRAAIKLTSRVAYAMGSLGDVRSLEVLAEISGWVTSEETETVQAILSVVPQIAQKAENQAVRDQAAEILIGLDLRLGASFRDQLLIRGDVLPKCDSARVTAFLCQALAQSRDDKNKTMSRHSIVLARMTDCYLPTQLEIDDIALSEEALTNLKGYLLADDGYDGRAATPLSDLKAKTVTALLRLGRIELKDWFPQILESERRLFTAHDFVNALAILKFEPLPLQIAQFITEEIDLRQDEEAKLILRLSAFRLARSAASEDAFATLLSPGLRYNGSIMLDTVEALADVSLQQARSEAQRGEVTAKLFAHLGPQYSEVVRSSASRAISAVALSGYLEPEDGHPLVDYLLAREPSDDSYIHSQLVQALGCLPVLFAPTGLIDKLSRWGQSLNDWLGWRSIEALLKMRMLEQQTWIRGRLGLELRSGRWLWSAEAAQINWASSFVMLLYGQNRAEYAEAAAATLLDSNWEASERAALALCNICREGGPAEESVIAEALVTRAKKRNRPNSSDLSVFWYLARATPYALGAEDWSEVWLNWTPDAKAALADSFRAVRSHSISDRSALATLGKLLDDSHFGVRRAAARSLSQLSLSLLEGEFARRCTSIERNERIRAAELIPCLADSEENARRVESLQSDPVRNVRDASRDALAERTRRRLASRYYAQISSVADPSDSETLRVVRYVQSLAEVGDDSTLADLGEHLQEAEMASRVRHLKSWLYKELEQEWRKRRDKWPQPLAQIQGTIVTGEGSLRIQGASLEGRYRLWTKARDSRGQHFDWGGEIYISGYQPDDRILTLRGQLVLADGRQGDVYVEQTLHQSSSPEAKITFSGVSEFP